MVDNMTRLLEIYELSPDAKEVVIFTCTFKARGKLLTDKSKIKDDLVTLIDAVICPAFEKCQCEETAQYYEWLNIFDKDILAFSVI